MDESPEYPIIAAQGVDGSVVRFSDRLTEPANRAALALRAALEGGAVPGVEEASSALASVYARFGGDVVKGRAALARLVRDEDFMRAELPSGRKLWRIPAVFGGADGPALDSVAGQIGLSPETALHDLIETRLRVLAIGFAPGQPYLGQLPETWDIPRLGTLTNVPAGALAVAIRQIVLFTNGSPTGWQHVGQTAFRCFRPEAERAFPLAPGDEVSFAPVSGQELAVIRERDKSGDGGAQTEPLR